MKGKLTQMSKAALTLGLVVAMASCGSKGANDAKSNDADTLRTELVALDSVWHLDEDDEFLKEYPVGMDLKLEMPSFEQNPVLANAVMEWVAEQLGISEAVNLKDGKAILKQCLADLEDGQHRDYSVYKVYDSPQFVSFEMEGYDMYVGAAHGTPVMLGATFRKSDGKLFGWNAFKRGTVEDGVQPFLKEGLMKYFDAVSETDLADNLAVMDPYSIDYLPMPDAQPWLTKEGVHMQYQAYEIACYAAGMPGVIVPLKDMEPLMTGLGKSLLEKK